MSETKKPISLKWKLTLVIVGLWVLPIILIIWIYGQYITTNIQANNERTILNSVSTAVKICKNRMESSIVASRNASYNTTIKDAYAEYKLSNNKVDLYTKVNDFLKQQYKYDDKFNMAVIYFTDGSQDIYYSMANHAKYASTISSFKEEALFEVKKFANTIGTQIGFININDRLYMVRNMFDSNYERFAVLTLEVNKEMMFESFESVVWCNGVTVQINDTWFTVIGDEIIIAPDSWAGYYTEPQLQKEKNGTYVCGTEYESSYTLSYAVKVDTNAMSNEFTTFLTMMFTIILLLVPMFIGLVLMFQNNILKPVTELVKTSAKIEKGLFGAKTRGSLQAGSSATLPKTSTVCPIPF